MELNKGPPCRRFIVCNEHKQGGLPSPAHPVPNPSPFGGVLFQHPKSTLRLIDRGPDVVSWGRGLWGLEAFEASLASWKTGGKGFPRPRAAEGATGGGARGS